MKFWRHSLLAAIAFIGISLTVVNSSCTEDECTMLKCRNNGTCVDGYCKCPTGWEGTQCESMASDRFKGRYTGTTEINEAPPAIDSAVIFPLITDSVYIGTVNNIKVYRPVPSASKIGFIRFSRPDDTLMGTISSTDGKVVINDGKYGGRTVTIIIDNGKLVVTSVEKPSSGNETITFVGNKTREW
ncbi:MAG: calcium-binding EGF-like domain-containing protein [Bacteroidetes bacterium]|nr:calcium-binding EGF-like domain-containing protein [Bacteroidota bacterium]